ncbi:MAG: 3-isopropylmalate dehydratase small subunit [Desulfovibrionaceae bacterium]|jgi:3-isopropylmalate/(R)-2-methylmalate dehydratase small subunit|nr:3-isopropylmalate dehydratase small subunit [Desulfovibrionaceae bacterium]
MSALDGTGGKAFKVGDDVNTDYIISARYLDVYEPEELRAHLFEGLGPERAARAASCTVLVAGRNLGCGSAREQAPNALKGAGYKAVIAASAARIFFRNAINVGLPVICAPDAAEAVNDGETVAVDLAAGTIRTASGATFAFAPFPAPVRRILEAGGMYPLLAELAATAGRDATGTREGASWA